LRLRAEEDDRGGRDDPNNFYVNVHDAKFPGGILRGTLSRASTCSAPVRAVEGTSSIARSAPSAPPSHEPKPGGRPRAPSTILARVSRVFLAAGGLLAGHGLYRLAAAGSLTLDTGIGRRVQPLGPVDFDIAAPREIVFDAIAAPYLGKTPRALQNKLSVWERGTDMVLAAHFTQVERGTTTTVETVRFERPEHIHFRVVRGPVPHVVESFALTETDGGTRLTWQGELGTDFWAPGSWWGGRVAREWERAVRRSISSVTTEAERRAR